MMSNGQGVFPGRMMTRTRIFARTAQQSPRQGVPPDLSTQASQQPPSRVLVTRPTTRRSSPPNQFTTIEGPNQQVLSALVADEHTVRVDPSGV